MKKIICCGVFIFFLSGCGTTSSERAKSIDIPTPIVHQDVIREEVIADKVTAQNKITYSQVTNLIGEFLEISPVETDSGQKKILAVSEDNLVILELKGDMDDIREASMKLFYPEDIKKVNADLNNAMMLRFLRNIAPEVTDWQERVNSITDRFSSLADGNIAEEDINLDRKSLHILYDKNIDAIIVTLKT